MKSFEIFKAGRHTASNGETLEFGENDLASSAGAYDPAIHEAPIVVGHPKTDAPAYGWVGGLVASGQRLVASPHQVDAAFAEQVEKGAYKKVSACFYTPEAKDNPVPGVYYLRHVGFLGALPPAVKGLKPVAFGESDEGTVTVEFGESDLAWSMKRVARMFQSLRDFLIGEFGQEKADKAIDPWEVTAATESAARAEIEAAGGPQASFAERPTDKTKEILMNEAEIKAREGKLAADTAALDNERQTLARERAEFAEARKREAATAAVEALVNEGKVLPAEKDGMVAFMVSLDAEGTVQFGEGEAGKKTPAAFFGEFLKALPKRVEFAERSAGEGGDVDVTDPAAVAAEAVAYQEEMRGKGQTIAIDLAVRHVIDRNKG